MSEQQPTTTTITYAKVRWTLSIDGEETTASIELAGCPECFAVTRPERILDHIKICRGSRL